MKMDEVEKAVGAHCVTLKSLAPASSTCAPPRLCCASASRSFNARGRRSGSCPDDWEVTGEMNVTLPHLDCEDLCVIAFVETSLDHAWTVIDQQISNSLKFRAYTLR